MTDTVRLATAADAVLLPDLERSAAELFRALPELAFVADDGPADAAFNLPMIEQGLVWLAEADGAPAGFLRAEIVDEALHVLELAVALPFQRRGLGKRLLDAARDAAWARGLRAVTLTTFAHVAWNGPFYAGYGFERVAAPTGALAAHIAEETARGLPHRIAMRLAL